MAMKLYHAAGSPNSRRVRIFLAEKGIDVELISVDLGAGEQRSDAYRVINPRLTVPALVTQEGPVVAEVTAIWRYIEERFPEPALLGKAALGKATVTMWERRAELEGFAAVMEGVRNRIPGLKERAIAGPHAYEQIPDLVGRSERRVADFLVDLNDHLGKNTFVAGDEYSAADITALVTVDFAKGAMGVSIGDTQVSLRNWYDVVSSRSSAKA